MPRKTVQKPTTQVPPFERACTLLASAEKAKGREQADLFVEAGTAFKLAAETASQDMPPQVAISTATRFIIANFERMTGSLPSNAMARRSGSPEDARHKAEACFKRAAKIYNGLAAVIVRPELKENAPEFPPDRRRSISLPGVLTYLRTPRWIDPAETPAELEKSRTWAKQSHGAVSLLERETACYRELVNLGAKKFTELMEDAGNDMKYVAEIAACLGP